MQTDASVDIPEQDPAVVQLMAAGLYTNPRNASTARSGRFCIREGGFHVR